MSKWIEVGGEVLLNLDHIKRIVKVGDYELSFILNGGFFADSVSQRYANTELRNIKYEQIRDIMSKGLFESLYLEL